MSELEDKLKASIELVQMQKMLDSIVPEHFWGQGKLVPGGTVTLHIDTAFGGKPVGFDVKDSGVRERFDSGMVRDTQEGKVLYDLVFDGPMLERWAVHLTKGAQKYDPRNWMKATGDAEYERFRASAVRHFFQLLRGDTDEDHAAAVFFNVNGMEYMKEKLRERKPSVQPEA